MKISDIINEAGKFQMKLSSKNADDYTKQEHKTSDSPQETQKRHKEIAGRYNVNIVDDYDRYISSGSKPTDQEKSPLTKSPRK